MRDERLDDPTWVATELERRGGHVFVPGEDLPDDRDKLWRWARLGGLAAGDVVSARAVNRGQLIELLEGRSQVKCWSCGVEPDRMVDVTTLSQAEPEYLPVWPASSDHEHAERPPTPAQLEQDGHAVLQRIRALAS